MSRPRETAMYPVHKEIALSSEIRPYFNFEPFDFYGFKVTPLNYPIVCGHIEGHFHDLVAKLAEELQRRDVEIRVCSHCGNFMVQGYCIEGGDEYYCTDECLHEHYTEEEWNALYDDGDTDSYWTEWEGEAPVYQMLELQPTYEVPTFSYLGHMVNVYTFREVREIVGDQFDYQLRDFDELLESELFIKWDE